MFHLLKNKFVWIALLIILIVSINLIQANRKNEVITDHDAVLEKDSQEFKVTEKEKQESQQQEQSKEMMVDLKGAIKHPGVFRIEEGSRVIDVIRLAGGFKQKADQNKVNLAEKIVDEMVIYVPEIGEEPSLFVKNNDLKESEQNEMIDINHASVEELEKIPGVGPTKAKNILDYIMKNGSFVNIEQLDEVNGIGKKSLEQMKPFILIR